MNHVPSHLLAAEARPLTRRAMAKLRTRQSLLVAGKTLFTERGYEQATVRDIARAAGLSTGAVFANFSDKADLFAEILTADDESLTALVRPISTEDAPMREVLVRTLRAAYAFHLDQLPLLQAAQSVSWSPPTDGPERLSQGDQLTRIIEEVLARGIAKGEVSAKTDLALLADLIYQAYLSNYRLAADGADLSELMHRLGGQLDLILGGLKA